MFHDSQFPLFKGAVDFQSPILANVCCSINWRKSSINPPVGHIYFKRFWRGWGLFERWGGSFNLAKSITADEVSWRPTYDSWAPYRFFKQPEFGSNSPRRTRTQNGKGRADEVGGYAAEDQKQILILRKWIDHIGLADMKCWQSWREA